MGALLDVSSSYTDLVTKVFTTTIAFKAWFATAAIVLVIVQVLSAARIYGKLKGVIPIPYPPIGIIHRWSGRLALLLTLPVAFHCIFILGFQTTDTRVVVHSIAGSFVYGVFAAKIFILKDGGYPRWLLPIAGGALFSVLATLWLTSSLWYFTRVRFGF
jgi:Family of unknown function (DUF6529)